MLDIQHGTAQPPPVMYSLVGVNWPRYEVYNAGITRTCSGISRATASLAVLEHCQGTSQNIKSLKALGVDDRALLSLKEVRNVLALNIA